MTGLNLFGSGNILAVGAHPDDIEYGCLGLFCRLPEDCRVSAYVLTTGRPSAKVRIRETCEAFGVANVANVEVGPFQSATLRPDRETVASVEEQIEACEADTVLTTTKWDTHQDHRAVEQIVMAATRRSPISVIGYQPPSAVLDFPANMMVDITDVFERKLEALSKHSSQQSKRYFSEEFLRAWHTDKLATSLGLKYVELFHVYTAVWA